MKKQSLRRKRNRNNFMGKLLKAVGTAVAVALAAAGLAAAGSKKKSDSAAEADDDKS